MSISYNYYYYTPILVLKHWNKSNYSKTIFFLMAQPADDSTI